MPEISDFAEEGQAVQRVDTARLYSFTTMVVAIMLQGIVTVSLLFFLAGYYGPWFLVKPGILVGIAEEQGRLNLRPYVNAVHWYQEGANFHSLRWAQTLLFLALHYVAPMDDRAVANAPFGILIFLISLLYAFSGFRFSTRGQWKWAFCLSALLYLVNYPMLTWVYHSGAWPGVSLVLLSIGTATRLTETRRDRSILITLLMMFLIMTFQIYHAAMITLSVVLTSILAYGGVNFLASRRRAVWAMDARLFFGASVVAWGLLFLDPLFELFVGGTGLSTPGPSITHFIQTLLRQGNTFPFQVGYSSLGRLALIAPLGFALFSGAGFWIRDHFTRLVRREAMSVVDVVTGGLFISVPVLGLLTILAGEFRYAEAGFVLSVAMPLLAARSRFLGGPGSDNSAKVPRIAILVTSAAVISFACFLTILREPITRYAYVRASDGAVAGWIAERSNDPIFSDMLLSALILRQKRNAQLVSIEGVPEAIERFGRIIYSGLWPFVEELRRRGADSAVLSSRNFRVSGPENAGHALLTASYFIRPLPGYQFTDAYLERLYDNGSSTVIALGRGRL